MASGEMSVAAGIGETAQLLEQSYQRQAVLGSTAPRSLPKAVPAPPATQHAVSPNGITFRDPSARPSALG
jgi:hypothetical protein